MRQLVAAARVGRLATITADARPHLVPICFALMTDGARDVIVSGTDEKPKSTPKLRRLANVRTHPAVALLVDHYEEEWSRVWWVRVDGQARVLDDGPEHAGALAALRAKYDQYTETTAFGAVLAIDVERWRGWRYAG